MRKQCPPPCPGRGGASERDLELPCDPRPHELRPSGKMAEVQGAEVKVDDGEPKLSKKRRLEAPAEAVVPGAFLPVLVGMNMLGRSRCAPKLQPPGCRGPPLVGSFFLLVLVE
ncbi:hypothetical protein J1605_006784 [Eschrichtius robustus]|uniref:Uncharacterized protein n=1 Tax=Eschrichtius robustus TaxID=9764 RepID=A0AB34H545_ESCRO|nr:hypothetical protein J1605_006784 [Eschrichtius robustus]